VSSTWSRELPIARTSCARHAESVTAPRADSDDALTYLEADVYEFRSGYERARVARWLSGVSLDASHRARARKYVLDVVDGEKHCAQQAVGQLARAVADNPMRASLRVRLRADDVHVARRAVRTLSRIRHPGLTPGEATLARDLVLRDAARTAWLEPNVKRLALWLWTPEWEAELRDLTQHHGPERAPAKKLLESIDRRRGSRRPGP
jgi:hypothetical protein